ncbi:phage tail protein [Yersinia enterocolitica]|uniref:phage tail protein n=1 Tax=Yersinia enterocolitica TaxID=630 RepID=UPI0005DB82A5|nr:phage tail protein [Yersinia enterocolitica]CNK26503.1 P2 phage tail completion R family protein [Yersinia enterocolitica]CRY18900.1 P2 phage tail completion R family protein [Yersinia enterocolitica]HDL6510327.1 phage tail protein [Yersinia enterocolitica]HDL7836179.1 phage tail protein [Yersinia enterocolitica]HDL8286791.1 phage tail protein [Yersinia enterocolitica]
MLKPKSLRSALEQAAPALRNNPDMLRVFIDNGTIATTLAASLSFEHQYTLNLIITDWCGELDLLIVPINAWLRENQPDIMTTDEGKRQGFSYFADLNNSGSIDISFSLRLTERVIVKQVDKALHIKHLDEPLTPIPTERPTDLYINGELVSQWDE